MRKVKRIAPPTGTESHGWRGPSPYQRRRVRVAILITNNMLINVVHGLLRCQGSWSRVVQRRVGSETRIAAGLLVFRTSA